MIPKQYIPYYEQVLDAHGFTKISVEDFLKLSDIQQFKTKLQPSTIKTVWGLAMRAGKWADTWVIYRENSGLKPFVTLINGAFQAHSGPMFVASFIKNISKGKIQEKLSKSQPASEWIDDFVKSENPMFDGKSKEERIKMALGAYYAAQKIEEAVEKIACLQCDAVSTKDAWKKNRGFCPVCKTSTQGVAESKVEEEYGAGFEGTNALRDKYIKDTPGQRIQQFKTEMNQQTYISQIKNEFDMELIPQSKWAKNYQTNVRKVKQLYGIPQGNGEYDDVYFVVYDDENKPYGVVDIEGTSQYAKFSDAKAGLKFALNSMSETLQEVINIRDYMATSEKSQFGGYRPKVVGKDGKTMYLGDKSYKTPEAAKDHAEEYLKQYASGISSRNIKVNIKESESIDFRTMKDANLKQWLKKNDTDDSVSAVFGAQILAAKKEAKRRGISAPSNIKVNIKESEEISLDQRRQMKIVALATGSADLDKIYEYVTSQPLKYSSLVELKENFNNYIQSL